MVCVCVCVCGGGGGGGGAPLPVLYSTKVCYLHHLELGLFPHSCLEVQPTLTKNVEC